MQIKKLKVRARKTAGTITCAPELKSMLGCWSAYNDLTGTGACAQAAATFFECMRTAPLNSKKQKPTINYHLARLGKTLK